MARTPIRLPFPRPTRIHSSPLHLPWWLLCCAALTLGGCGATSSDDSRDGSALDGGHRDAFTPDAEPPFGSCEVGGQLLTYEPGSFTGYTLYAPVVSTTTYLIDPCGAVAHSWVSDHTPGLAAYLLPGGHLLRAGSAENLSFSPSSAGGVVEKLDWDGTVLWRFDYSSPDQCLHHDVAPLPGGNVLMIAWEKKTAAEAIAAGRDMALINFGELWPDHVIEVEPTLPEGGTIVWEWHAWDHLIQDHDPAADNYGDVAAHPELLDLNFTGDDGSGGADWNHINSIDYNEALDQILLSFHTTSEIVVIDHSTTTQEAAAHTGGLSGKGGDILYRWGNPQAYRARDGAARTLFGQHDARWIPLGLANAGNILVFNNGLTRGFSTVDEILPPLAPDGRYLREGTAAFGPVDTFWSYGAPTPSDFFSPMISGAQRLPNGNTLICSGHNGLLFEVTQDGTVVWEYDADAGALFRATRYAPDYPGLARLQR